MSVIMKAGLSFQPPSLLLKRFATNENVSESETHELFLETKKFLIMCAMNRGKRYSPSPKIDAMWHQFILHTRDYLSFCDALGGFIHHQPAEKPAPEGYSLTRTDMQSLFGDLDQRYWTERSSDCDDCNSSCDCCP